MKGIEYCLLLANEPILYVIRKQQRTGPETVIPLEDFYILSGTVYKCPSIKSLVHSKLRNISHILTKCLEQSNSLFNWLLVLQIWLFIKNHLIPDPNPNQLPYWSKITNESSLRFGSGFAMKNHTFMHQIRNNPKNIENRQAKRFKFKVLKINFNYDNQYCTSHQESQKF